MQVGVVGINHKLAELKLREKLAISCQRRFGPSNSTHGDHSFILLSTCNRTEVYFSSDDLASTHTYFLNILRQEVDEEFDHKLYSYFGRDCFYHLCRVSAGLDSAILAESEIQRQVKDAYEAAASATRLPPEHHFLFQKSLKISKQIRTELPMGRGMPDLEHAIYQAGQQFFESPANAKVLFIGASLINLKVLSLLKAKNIESITLCNRSDIQNMANVQILPWNQLQQWTSYDWIICGTKCPTYLLSTPPQTTDKKLIIDLSVPRNVDPDLAKCPSIQLLNIDQINQSLQVRKHHLQNSLSDADEMITLETSKQIKIFHNKNRILHNTFAITA